MKTKLALLLSLALAATSLAADTKPAHLFILSGQSNMQGMDPKTGFLPEAEKLFPDATVDYIKVSRGGQPIRLWVEQWNAIAEKHGIDTRIDATRYYQPILEGFKQLLAKHPEPASVTFCWMQGERDAREKLHAAYPDAMRQLIANLRRDLQQPNMNVVIARISDNGTPDNAPWQAVRRAHVDVATSDPHGAWVDCDDLNDKTDKNGNTLNDLHYTKPGYELLGRRFARQAKALITGKAPAEDGRPN